MMAIEDAGTRYPQKFRRVCSAGEPLNPEAIRWFRDQYGLTVLDYYGLTECYPLVRQLPVHGGPRGLDGPADAGLGRPAPRRGRAARWPRASAARSACARARTPTIRSATGATPEASRGDLRRRLVSHQGRRDADEDGYIWYAGRADDVIIAAGYRIGPFEVESACLEHAAVARGRRGRLARRAKGNVVKAFIVLAEGHEPSDELAEEIKRFVRERLSAYAYPRLVEFVRRPAQDADRQDPPHRAARARGRGGQGRRLSQASRRATAKSSAPVFWPATTMRPLGARATARPKVATPKSTVALPAVPNPASSDPLGFRRATATSSEACV